MKFTFALCTALLLCLFFSPMSFTAEKKPHAVKGTIKELGEATITVLKKGDHEAVFKTNEETTFDVDGKESALTDLKVGMYILVQNNKDIAVKVWASETNKRVGPSKK